MNLLRSRCAGVFAVVAFACLIAVPSLARAQTSFELGGGWSNLKASGPAAWGRGWSARASIAWQIAPKFRWRVDAFTSHFRAKEFISQPCPAPPLGCSGPGFGYFSQNLNGLDVNGVLNIDPRGILYALGGAGVANLSDGSSTQTLFVASAGLGVAVPVAGRVLVFIESRWDALLGFTQGPNAQVPITLVFDSRCA
jgi:hypothetical protein